MARTLEAIRGDPTGEIELADEYGAASEPTTERGSNQLLVVIEERQDYPLDLAVKAWLASKYNHSQSEATRLSYEATLSSYLHALEQTGLEVTSPARETSLVLQVWADYLPRGRRGSRYGKDPTKVVHKASANTYNQRISVVASFYEFVRRRNLLTIAGNPAELVERERVEGYDAAQPLELQVASDLLERLRAAYSTSVRAKRDYVLIAIALQTGRRLEELRDLRWGDVRIDRIKEEYMVMLTFRAKGGKTMRDQLPTALGEAFLGYVRAVYGPEGAYWQPREGMEVVPAVLVDRPRTEPAEAIGTVPDDLRGVDPVLPIWISLAHDGSLGHQLSRRGIAYLCQRRIGSGKFHLLRHTFAHSMDEVGAGVATIQQRLGHASLATTGRYLTALAGAKNVFGERLAQRLGTNQAPDMAE